MSISDIFNAANTGITMQRLAIEVTGENVANVNTEGYSRQRVNLESSYVREVGNYSLGSGVKLGSIERAYDGLLQKQITNTSSSYNQTLTEQTALNQIEPLFNEISTDGLGKSIQDFFDSWQDLSLNPQGIPERQAVISRAEIMVDTFHQTNTSLENIRTNANQSLVTITGSISETVTSIASLNDQIRTSELTSGNANELRDKRDLAVRQLSEKVGITYFEESNGALSVSLPNGQQLISGSSYATMYTSPNSDGLNDIYITMIGAPPSAPDSSKDSKITSLLNGTSGNQGEIGGTLQVRDVIVPDMLNQIDALAYVISSEVNTQHEDGYDLSGNTGNPFFDILTVQKGSSSSIGVSAAVKNNPNNIAAASAPNEPGNNINALAIAEIFTQTQDFTIGTTTTTTTIPSFYTSMVSTLGIDVQAANNQAAREAAYSNQLNNQRESISGVSLDEELANLIKYQKAYEGNAKMITTASDMMDIILGLVR